MNRKQLQRWTLLLVAAVAAVLILQTVAVACPSCKESLAHSDPARANMVRGYFWSILFMMSMPFLILGGLSTLFWWEVRKARLAKARNTAMVGTAVE
jgi:heme/copper-type cytochrome/quinol oxidase subunit 2